MSDIFSRNNILNETLIAFTTSTDQKSLFRRRKICFDMLSSIDQTGELIGLMDADEVDPVKQERLERADRHTSGMDAVTYQEYTEARQVNFGKLAECVLNLGGQGDWL